jgi:hypothetical protein
MRTTTQAEAAVLRPAALGDIELAEDLHARHDRQHVLVARLL